MVGTFDISMQNTLTVAVVKSAEQLLHVRFDLQKDGVYYTIYKDKKSYTYISMNHSPKYTSTYNTILF